MRNFSQLNFPCLKNILFWFFQFHIADHLVSSLCKKLEWTRMEMNKLNPFLIFFVNLSCRQFFKKSTYIYINCGRLGKLNLFILPQSCDCFSYYWSQSNCKTLFLDTFVVILWRPLQWSSELKWLVVGCVKSLFHSCQGLLIIGYLHLM